VTAGSAAVELMLPVPPPLTNAPSLGHVAQRSALDRPDDQVLQRPPGHVVGQSGDLPLVGHHPDQPHPRTTLDLRGHGTGRRGRADGRALGPEAQPSAQRPVADVEVQAHPYRCPPEADRPLDQLEVLDAVDHHRRGAVARGRGERGELPQRGQAGPGIGHQLIGKPLPVQPQRFRQGEIEQSAKSARQLKEAPQQRPAAHRLRGHADRLALGAAQHVLGVGGHGVEIHERERRL